MIPRPRNRYRIAWTMEQVESLLLNYLALLAILLGVVFVLLSTLAKTACAPAVRLVPATHPTKPPYNLVIDRPASDQAGELAAFYSNNF